MDIVGAAEKLLTFRNVVLAIGCWLGWKLLRVLEHLASVVVDLQRQIEDHESELRAQGRHIGRLVLAAEEQPVTNVTSKR